MRNNPSTEKVKWYVLGVVIGAGLAVWSAFSDFNFIAYLSGLLLGGGAVALNREIRNG